MLVYTQSWRIVYFINLSGHKLVNFQDSTRCAMVLWICKLLSNIHQELVSSNGFAHLAKKLEWGPEV
jgi:hypothetical protein